MKNTKTLVLAALMTALTTLATYIIRIPTPTLGYVNLGDAFVLLCSLLLGPVIGPLCAGLGSALSDLFAGYLIYVPATFIIKALVSLTGYYVFKLLTKSIFKDKLVGGLIFGGIAGELVMVLGYFLFEIFLLAFSEGGALTGATLYAGIIASAAGIFPNMIQGAFGVVIYTILYPILKKVMQTNTAVA